MGPSGSGKSTWIRDEIGKTLRQTPLGPPLFWITPDVLSYTTERMLLETVPTVLRAEVIPLQRLALRLQSQEMESSWHPLTATGSRLLLAEVFRATQPELAVLGKSQPTVGLLDALLDTFDAFAAAEVGEVPGAGPEAANALGWADAADSSLWLAKQRDVLKLYQRWRQAKSEGGLYQPSDLLNLVRKHLGHHPMLEGARLFIDGYADMTPSELAFVLALAERAEETVVSFCLCPEWTDALPVWSMDELNRMTLTDLLGYIPDQERVFAPQTLRLFARMRAAAASRKLPLGDEVRLAHPAPEAGGLAARLHDAVFTPRAKDTDAADGQGVCLAAAQNIRVEADGVAREILRLHREAQVPYAEVMVLVPDWQLYFPYLREAFRRHGVAALLDEFPSLANHPAARFLLAALRCVEDGFSLESMLRLLKTDFCQLTPEAADWLETYLRKYEVAGPTAWLQGEPWRFAWENREQPDDESSADAVDQRAEQLRQTLLQYIRPLSEQLASPECTPQHFAAALWTLLEAVNARRTVAEWMVTDTVETSPLAASLHEQAWQRMMALLSDLHDNPVQRPVPRNFLVNMVRTDVQHQHMTTIPAGVGQVLVSEYERAQGARAEVVFVLGAVDGRLPRRWKSGGLFADGDYLRLRKEMGVWLADTAEERQLSERKTLYTVLTRAEHRLYLTAPLADVDGKEARPAAVVARLREHFGDRLQADALWTSVGDGGDETWRWWTASSALDRLLEDLRPDGQRPLQPAQRAAIFRWFSATPQRRQQLVSALAGVIHRTKAQPLDEATARRLYGAPVHLSAYQVESFYKCPYQHFVTFGLRLKEEVGLDITAALRGTLLHDVIHRFVDRMSRDMQAWRAMEDDAAVAAMRQVFEQWIELPKAAMWRRRAVRKYLADEAWSVLARAAVVLTRHARHGRFTPALLEAEFDVHMSAAGGDLHLALGDDAAVHLRGRVDRVDVLETDSGTVFRIVDYKSRQLNIKLSDVDHGLQLQLPLYAAVIEQISPSLMGTKATPVGLIYLPLLRKWTTRSAPLAAEAARAERIRAMQARGLMVHHVDVVAGMDERLTQPDAKSDLFATVYKKNGELYANAPVLSPDDWRRLLAVASRRVGEAVAQMERGVIDIAPYRKSRQETACHKCGLQRVCQIDPRWDGTPFRTLDNLSNEQVLARWSTDESGRRDG